MAMFNFGIRRILDGEYEWYLEMEDGQMLMVKWALGAKSLQVYLPCLAIDAGEWDMPNL